MNTSLETVIPSPGTVGHPVLTPTDALRLDETLAAALAPGTRRCYGSAWHTYQTWLRLRGYENPLEPSTIAGYLSALAETKSPSSVDLARAAILHNAGSLAPILASHQGIRRTMRGTRRMARGRQIRQARALTRVEIRRMIDTVTSDDTPRGAHNRVVLLLGLALGVRANELCGIHLSDLHSVDGGLDVTIRFSKTSDLAVTIPVASVGGLLCPVAAVASWLTLLTRLGVNDPEAFLLRPILRGGMTVGDGQKPLSPATISGILQCLAISAGIDTTGLKSHSLRATYATRALESGFSDSSVAMGRWAEGSSMLHHYDRRTRWEHPASLWLGQ